jgi:hypothetical protein
MNNRLRELLVQSDNALERDGKLYPHIGSRQERDWKRFAELIIKECYNAANQYIDDCGEVSSLPSYVFDNHFGVK